MQLLVLLVIAGMGTVLLARTSIRRAQQHSAANAAGLRPVADLSHLPPALGTSALWALAEGGFERRVVHGVLPRGAQDVDVTAFDLETLRARRGEWAWLPVEPPFRIWGLVSIVACELDAALPHMLLKVDGEGDRVAGDRVDEHLLSIAKLGRDVLMMPDSHPADLPATLPAQRTDVELPHGWRAYTKDPAALEALLAGGLRDALVSETRRDLVIELNGGLVLVYPAARDVSGADALADLTTTALSIVDGVLRAVGAVAPRVA
ncbi:MAG TPA: hypothetical protein VGM88_34920 [Kofleriaceae bacterium]